MFIKTIIKSNTKGGKKFCQYRLVESYRLNGKPRHRTILNLGAISILDDSVEKRKQLADRIEALIHGNRQLFPPHLEVELEELAQKYYAKLIGFKATEIVKYQSIESEEKGIVDYQSVDLNSISHENVREIGGEWMCKSILDRLDLSSCLSAMNWSKKWITIGLVSIISRAIFAESEHKTAQWLRINSGLLDLFDLPYDGLSRHHLYEAARRLYAEKTRIEQYLSGRTNELFDQEDSIILYDLTNVYFEGRKENSKKAAFGRSKEKRSDAKLLVLAVVVNTNGFIKYSQFYKGNMSDSKTLKKTIEDMEQRSGTAHSKKLVVIDAGIATEKNLEMLRDKKYDYLCVSRRKIAEYEAQTTKDVVELTDQRGNPIEIKRLTLAEEADYFIYVWSTQKQQKEQSMEDKLTERYVAELEKIHKGTQTKGGTKRVEKVWERIGRLKQKYIRVHKYFDIQVNSKEGIATKVYWTQKQKNVNKNHGVYFLRTTLKDTEEKNLWKIYQTLKEIEYTFRVLKTDLNLRPVFHQNDENMEAHLFLGILAYQLVCSIRYTLKNNNINEDWSNIVRIMGTHKVVTTFLKGEKQNYFITKTCRPSPRALSIYKALGISSIPFKMKKSVVPH